MGARAQKPVFWGPFLAKKARALRLALFFWVRGPCYAGTFRDAGTRFPPSFGPFGPKMVEKWAQKVKNRLKKSTFFLRYWALARSNPGRDLLLTAYSCSHRAYGSNGVSHSPNPAGGWEKTGPKVGPVVKFLGKNGVKPPRNPFFHHFAPRGSSDTCEVSK